MVVLIWRFGESAGGDPNLGEDVMAMDITFYFIHIHYAARCIHVKWQLRIAALHATYQPVVTSYFHNGDHRIKIRQYFVRSMHVYIILACGKKYYICTKVLIFLQTVYTYRITFSG